MATGKREKRMDSGSFLVKMEDEYLGSGLMMIYNIFDYL